MVQPPAGKSTIDEALSERAPHPERLALSWLFPLGSARLHALTARCVIGRADDCDVRLVGRAVSRHHAEISRQAATLRLVDLRSTNGVFLNGISVTDSPVAAGDLLRVGNWVGCFVPDQPGTEQPGLIRELGPELWGDAAFARTIERVRSAARSGLPLVLTGENGTGKQLVARALHAWSGRQGPFDTLNCASASERQIETELFGRRTRRGAGGYQNTGLLTTMQDGTLLLEEASELSPALQRRLQRFLGSDQQDAGSAGDPQKVRLVLARHDQRGQRGDPLWKALTMSGSSLELWLPPLRQRVPEIPALFSHFVDVYSTGDACALDAELIEALCLYNWPGNVRELEFLARQLVAMHHGARELGPEHLPRRILEAVRRGPRESSGNVPLVDTARTTVPEDRAGLELNASH